MTTHPGGVRRGLVASAVTTLVVLLVTSLGLPGSAALDERGGAPVERVAPDQAADRDTWLPDGVADDRTRGEVYLGLDDSAACPGGFAVEDTHADPRARHCTHGPDSAPAGVDVQDVPTTAELYAAAAGDSGADTAAAGGAVPCYGDGRSGKRVQAIYAVAADRTDRYSSVVDLIRTYAYNADQTFANSAARDGGVRHLRWVTDANCQLAVDRVVLSATGDDTLGNTRTELRALGYTNVDRKYIVFADAAVYCGIAYTVNDTRPDSSNAANSGPSFARVDSACWSATASVVAHEIAHNLGAVQLTSPNANGAWHCTDEYDRMCYNDGSGATMTYPCAYSQEPVFDCGGNDYFSLSPAPGSWLDTHWNLADSAFLEAAEPGPTPTPTTASPTPTTASPTPTTASPTPTTASPTPTTMGPIPTSTATVSPSPTPTSTATVSPSPTPTATRTAKPRKRKVASEFAGTLTTVRPSRTFRVTSAAGPLVTRLDSRRAARLKVSVTSLTGKRVIKRWGQPVLTTASTVRQGVYRVTVSGPVGTRFTLRVVRYLT